MLGVLFKLSLLLKVCCFKQLWLMLKVLPSKSHLHFIRYIGLVSMSRFNFLVFTKLGSLYLYDHCSNFLMFGHPCSGTSDFLGQECHFHEVLAIYNEHYSSLQ